MADVEAIRERVGEIEEGWARLWKDDKGTVQYYGLKAVVDDLLAEVERQAKEIERLQELKASELPLTFPCGCGFGKVSGLEYIDSGTVLKCEECGMEQVVVMQSFVDKAERQGKEEHDEDSN